MENPSEPIIFLEGVNIANDDGVVIRDLSLSVERGGFIYIVGKVGSGKSTIIKSLIAEWPIKSGIARVGDFNLVKMKRRMIPHLRRSVGVVFQDFQLLMERTIEENLLFVLEATGWRSLKQMKERVGEVLEMVNLSDKLKRMPFQLSGGEQQRVAIARALVNHPAVVFADEPTGNLDSATTIEVIGLLKASCRKYNQTILMVTHSVKAASHAGRVLFIKDGEVFHQIYRGNNSSQEMYQKISDALTFLSTGGEQDE